MARADSASASAHSDSIKGLAQAVARPAYRRLLTAEPFLRRAVPVLIVAFLITLGIAAFVDMRERLRQAVTKSAEELDLVATLLLESVVSVINLSARRIAKEDERDLEQARVGIEAVRALVGLLDEEPAKQVREALSQVQMLYAQHAEGAPGPPGEGEEGPPGGAEPPSQERAQRGPSRLWTPPGTTPPR